MTEIFINYRRADSASASGRLADRLAQHFGRECVFLDRDAIEPGEDFPERLRVAVQSATVVLVVIGQDWLAQCTAGGERRLDQAGDYVRHEIEIALKNQIPIIPVLVEGAQIPTAAELPTTIRKLTQLNAYELSDRRWSEDAEKLLQTLEKYGIEALNPSGLPHKNSLFASISGYLSTLVDLLRHPVKTLLSKNRGRQHDFPDALLFGFITVILLTVFMVTAIPMKESAWMVVIGMPIMWVIVTLMFSAPLYAAWRLAGTQTTYRRIATLFAYQTAVVSVIFHALFASGVMMIALMDWSFADKHLAIIRGNYSVSQKLKLYQSLIDGVMKSYQSLDWLISLQHLFAIICLFFLAVGFIWLVVSWGAYRRILNANRIQSAFAFIAFISLVILPPYGLIWFANLKS